MSVSVMSMVFQRYPGGGGEMLLALALADHASDDGTRIYPSVAALAAKTRQSERTVQYQLRRMEEAGWLILVGGHQGGRGTTRQYRIDPAWIKGADPAPIKKGCSPAHERVQSTTGKGAIAAAPESSENHQETSGGNPPTPLEADLFGGEGEDEDGASQVSNPLPPSSTQPRGAKAPTGLHASPGPLPDGAPPGLTAEDWADFVAHRKERKAPLTDGAVRRTMLALCKLAESGNPPADVIDQSIRNGWAGVFPVSPPASRRTTTTTPGGAMSRQRQETSDALHRHTGADRRALDRNAVAAAIHRRRQDPSDVIDV